MKLWRKAEPGETPDVVALYGGYMEIDAVEIPWCDPHDQRWPTGDKYCDWPASDEPCRLEVPARHWTTP